MHLSPTAPSESGGCLFCGCPEEAHEHYRAGTDCGRCGRDKCPNFTNSKFVFYLTQYLRRGRG